MKRYPSCPVGTTLTLVGSQWTVLIFRELFTGIKRFSQLKKALEGISQTMLTQQLRAVEDNGWSIGRSIRPSLPRSSTSRPTSGRPSALC